MSDDNDRDRREQKRELQDVLLIGLVAASAIVLAGVGYLVFFR